MRAQLSKRDPLQPFARWLLVAGAALMIATPGQALAQSPFGGGNPNAPRARPPMPDAARPAPAREVAPALPGAESRDDMVAPADRSGMQMRPTEALFDAINRGDITAARDAVGRGAELEGRNVLGATPLELAIDLGRKDIVFYLLSMRGTDYRQAGPPGRVDPNAQGRRTANVAAVPRQQRQAAAQAARVTAAPAPATPKTAHLFAGDGGSPAPDAGFLGFDASRRQR